MTSRMQIAGLLVLLAGLAGSSPLRVQAAGDQYQSSPEELVRTTIAKETATANDTSIKHMFRDLKKTPQGSQTRLYVETREAMAGMTVAYDGKPLSPQQVKDEEGRLAGLAGSPEQLRHKQREQKEDEDRTVRIVRAFPEAFQYKYDGTEPGTATLARPGATLVRLKFWPNPSYRPPSHVEDVLLGMSGTLMVDPVAHRIARIDGTLFREVSFGWGILGHLDKGGHFFVEQEDLGDGSWEMSCMRLEFTGKILMVKKLAIKSEEVFSNFRRVPDGTTFAQGVEMLKAEQVKLARGGPETAKAENRP